MVNYWFFSHAFIDETTVKQHVPLVTYLKFSLQAKVIWLIIFKSAL